MSILGNVLCILHNEKICEIIFNKITEPTNSFTEPFISDLLC